MQILIRRRHRHRAGLAALRARDRVDVVLHERWQGLAQTRAMGLPVQVLEPPLARTPMHLHLHQKHAALVSRVAQALAGLKHDGGYDRIHDTTLGNTRP